MTEEDSTEIFLSNVEPNDFARFCEYAYTGDYFVINEHFPLPTRVGTNLERKLEHEEQKMDGIDTNFSSISNPEYERAHATIGACQHASVCRSTTFTSAGRCWDSCMAQHRPSWHSQSTTQSSQRRVCSTVGSRSLDPTSRILDDSHTHC